MRRMAPKTHEYYSFVTADWARKWPAEEIWAAREARLTLPELDVVTGAFSFTGRHIAEALLATRSTRSHADATC